jgi:cytochrome b pre-mRNA-processing protein 3
MFIHFSIMLIIFKKKSKKFDQKSYDRLFYNIENNLRELGFGDVSVNKKMKEFNKILYDILLKVEQENQLKKKLFRINPKLVIKYFNELNEPKNVQYKSFESYFLSFFNFCFEIPIDNMLIEITKFKY